MNSIESVLDDLGFELVQTRKSGDRHFAKRSTPYLSWWVLLRTDQTAELSWELELGEYLRAKGFAVSVQDELSLSIFPAAEARGPAEGDWLRAEIEKAASQLESVDLLRGT